MQLFEKEILGRLDDLLRNSLRQLKDEEYQKKIWFGNDDELMGSYNDACIYFLDRCEYFFKTPVCKVFLGTENYVLLKKLYDLVEEHFGLTEDRIDPDLIQEDELLNNPNWHDIQTLAEEVELKLKEFVTSKENERSD